MCIPGAANRRGPTRASLSTEMSNFTTWGRPIVQAAVKRAGFSTRRPVFSYRPGYAGFLVDKVSLGQLLFPLLILIPLTAP